MTTASQLTTHPRASFAARALGAGLLTGVLMTGVAATGASAASASDYSQEQVAAVAGSGVVYVAIDWSGYVLYEAESGWEWSDRIETSSSCSGFVADSKGYIVTAGHCADPAEGRKSLINGFLSEMVDDGVITNAEASEILPDGLRSWKVEGPNDGDAISRNISVYQTSAASGVQVSAELTASVVDNRPLEEGDVTLLKVQTAAPMPALQLADKEPEVGADIAAMGFPGSVSGVVDSSLEPSFKTGRASAHQTYNGLPFLQIDAAVSGGMSGGPVVDMHGDVVGIVSFSPFEESQSFNFAAGRETIEALLTRNGVNQELSTTDQTFRDGLTKYYADDFAGAIASFETVLSALPSHALAQQYKSKASQEESATGSESTAGAVGSGLAVAGKEDSVGDPIAPTSRVSTASASDTTSIPSFVWIAAAIALVLIAGITMVIIRNRRSGRPSQSATSAPMPAGPWSTCSTCGAGLAPSTRFCNHCGTQAQSQPFQARNTSPDLLQTTLLHS